LATETRFPAPSVNATVCASQVSTKAQVVLSERSPCDSAGVSDGLMGVTLTVAEPLLVVA
jgi:hypothetical protein